MINFGDRPLKLFTATSVMFELIASRLAKKLP